jgi:hypothetical protein
MGWKIEFAGHQLAEADVTMDHVLAVVELTGRDEWDVIDPSSSPKLLTAWCAVVLAIGTDESAEFSALYLRTRPITELLSAISFDVLDVPPEAAVVPVGESTPAHPLLAAMNRQG